MNKVIICGRLTKDAEVRTSQSGKQIARYTLAVDRYNSDADYISCVAFGKNAEFAEKYLSKGTKILIEGSIKTGSYTNKDNKKVYTTDVIVDRHEFVEKKADNNNNTNTPPKEDDYSFTNIPEAEMNALPFN